MPYTGGGQSVGSVVAGQTQWTLTPAPAAMVLVNAGRLKALGHSMGREARVLDGMPSLSDALPGFEFNGWIGVVAPRGMPAPAVAKFRAALTANGAISHLTAAAEFRALLVRDIDATRRTMRAAGIEPE